MADTRLRWCPKCRVVYRAEVAPTATGKERGPDPISHDCGTPGEPWGGGPPSGGFKAGDRVAHYSQPAYCGEIIELVQNTPAGDQWLIRWESDTSDSLLAEPALVPCYPSAET
jgi:hypothetical protein